MTNSALPFPIQPKALAVPSDDGLGFHNAQGGAPIGPNSGESDPNEVGRKIAIAGDGFGARAAAKEVDDGVPGSPRAERPEFEDSHEGRGAGKRGVRTFHCTLPRLAASSTLSMRTDFLVGTGEPFDRGFTAFSTRRAYSLYSDVRGYVLTL